MSRKSTKTRGKRKQGKQSESLKALLGLAALTRSRLPLWAKLALGAVVLGTIGYTSGLSGTMGIDRMLRRT